MATENKIVHPFEHFGPAPYRIVKLVERVYSTRSAMSAGYEKAGSTCDVCGTPIRWEYTVRAGNGAEFRTGCDCAQKCGMSAKELADAKRTYIRAEQARVRAAERSEREAAERKANGGLTDKEIREAASIGRDAARKWLEAERKVEAGHVGIVGKRSKGLELRVDYTAAYETFYGRTTVYVMRDRSGNCIVWKTSGCLGLDVDGAWKPATSKGNQGKGRVSAWFTCDATVKSHGERDGLKQTEVNRVKVRSMGKMEQVTETRFLRAA